MQNLLNALGSNVKPAGRDKWIAKCSVHNDKDFAMSIKLNADNSVVAYCHACEANGFDLYRSLGLDLDELFGGKQKEGTFVPNLIKDQLQDAKWFCAIFEADEKQGVNITLADKRNYKLQKARIKGIQRKFGLDT